MKTILILDTETTGTNDHDICIEVACALYSVEHATVVSSYASLLFATHNEAEHVNHIPVAALATVDNSHIVWDTVRMLLRRADVIVSHGAEFDRHFVPAAIRDGWPWICSMDDLAWPRATKPRESRVSLALAHGLGVGSAHRAAADVDLLARTLTRVAETGIDLPAFLARGLRPKARFVVADRQFDAARNEQAKAAGFAWDAAARVWARTMAIEDAAALPFAVEWL